MPKTERKRPMHNVRACALPASRSATCTFFMNFKFPSSQLRLHHSKFFTVSSLSLASPLPSTVILAMRAFLLLMLLIKVAKHEVIHRRRSKYMFRTVSVTLNLMKFPSPPNSTPVIIVTINYLYFILCLSKKARVWMCVHVLCFVDHHLRYYALFTAQRKKKQK